MMSRSTCTLMMQRGLCGSCSPYISYQVPGLIFFMKIQRPVINNNIFTCDLPVFMTTCKIIMLIDMQHIVDWFMSR